VAVVDLQENTYYASIVLDRTDEIIEVDARPSDAIALALRVKTPIFCESRVLEQAHLKQEEWEARQASAAKKVADDAEEEAEAPAEEVDDGEDGPRPIVEDGSKSLKELLEDLDPEDFGKYKM
jgi:bifunctional DNase/RNase